jgi:hypothetical protein
MNLGDLRICVEKPLPNEEHVIKALDRQSHTDNHFQKLQAAFQTSKLWPKGTKEITVQFVNPRDYKVNGQFYQNFPNPEWTPNSYIYGKTGADGKPLPVDPLEKELFDSSDYINVVKKIYMERIQPIIPFKIRFVEGNGNVRISFVGGAGSWSLVGTDCLHSAPDEVTLNYGWIDVPTIIHEFCHVLGMIHEHQNPKGNTIKWNENAVYEWAAHTQGWDQQTTYNNIIMRYSYDQVNGSDFDPQSVMLYFFPGSLTIDGIGTQQNMRLSPLDVIWIEKMYAGGIETPSQFYLKAYGEKIDKDGTEGIVGLKFDSTHKTRNLWIILAVIILIIILVVAVWFFFLKKNKSKKR